VLNEVAHRLTQNAVGLHDTVLTHAPTQVLFAVVLYLLHQRQGVLQMLVTALQIIQLMPVAMIMMVPYLLL